MVKSILIILLTLLSFNTYAAYYKTGKLYNVNELVNNVDQDIENYCKRNLSEFNKDMETKEVHQKKNTRFQLKTTVPSHNSRTTKLNIDACFNIEKQKFNNMVNIYYNNNDSEFLDCYEEIRDDRKTSISENFLNCFAEKRKEKCKYIITSDVPPQEKAIMYKNCLM